MALHTVVAGSGPRIVLVHGFAQTQACWGEVGDALASDHEVVQVDAPGHGGSADVRADLSGTADLLAEAGGPATYLGYSMGGRLALNLALSRPDLVERLVLIGATAGIDDPHERAARRRADDELAATIERDGVPAFIDRWLENPLFARLPADAAALADRRRNSVSGLTSSLRLAGTGAQEPSWDRLYALPMPVLVLAGEHDEKFRALGERLADSIGANARFEIVPDAGHPAHLERPDAVAGQIERFLAVT
jgi:2-succinyl-6-hydroxy-2,4-cyclohexadiene-1-carboxylate synthase